MPSTSRVRPAPSAGRPVDDARLAATAHNIAILNEVRRALAATLAASNRESAIRSVEHAVAATPERPLMSRAKAHWSWHIGLLFAALDLAAISIAWLVSRGAVDGLTFAVIAFVMIVICNRADLHRSRLELSVLDDVPAYVLTSVLGGLTLAGAGSVGVRSAPGGQTCFLFGLAAFVLFVLSRMVAFPVVRRLRRSRLIAHPVVIVGAGEVGQRLAAAMRAHPEYGLRPVGFVDFDASPHAGENLLLPILGDIGALPQIMKQLDAHDVVFAFSKQPDAHLVRVVRGCVRLDLQVFVVPRYFELCGTDRRARIETIWGIPLMRLRRWPLRRGHRWAKRLMDIGLASGALVLLAPVLALCALAVRLDGRPILFRQRRVGRDGRTFVIYKFRSMRPEGDDQDRCWSADGDARVTRIGQFLRRSSLDEVPQLINVVRGDMSLVGPRPERPYFVQSFSERFGRYAERHRVETGLTGLAQINGLRGDTSIEERVTFDNYYIDNWSLWSDVKIMLRTITSFMRHGPREVPSVIVMDRVSVPTLPDVLAS
jgi:exopolysaccharide biosynthesis polyprenyl glycosylphosphotransferase